MGRAVLLSCTTAHSMCPSLFHRDVADCKDFWESGKPLPVVKSREAIGGEFFDLDQRNKLHDEAYLVVGEVAALELSNGE